MSDMAPVMPPQVPSIQKLGPDLLTRPSRAWMKLWCVPSMVEEANKQAGWCDWGGGAHASACVEAPFDEVRPKVKGHCVRREENEEDDAEGQPGVEALPGRQESGNEAREKQTQGHRKELKKGKCCSNIWLNLKHVSFAAANYVRSCQNIHQKYHLLFSWFFGSCLWNSNHPPRMEGEGLIPLTPVKANAQLMPWDLCQKKTRMYFFQKRTR